MLTLYVPNLTGYPNVPKIEQSHMLDSGNLSEFQLKDTKYTKADSGIVAAIRSVMKLLFPKVPKAYHQTFQSYL
jgi:hypothetical protein